jgi:predicted phosphodiesterase
MNIGNLNIGVARNALCLAAVMLFLGYGQQCAAQIENRPYKVFDIKPKIVHGPILIRPTETSMTIMWTTDRPCQSKVVYGEDHLDHEFEPEQNGLIPVGTVHSVELSGLRAGHSYVYKIVSTPVIKLNAYWPDKGKPLESQVYKFTTFDTAKPTVSFSFITDTHEDIPRLESLLSMIDWEKTDFLVHGGDPLNSVESEDAMFSKWLDPISQRLSQTKPFVYVRGNHDMRGPFARDIARYMVPTGQTFYFATNDGPVHLVDLDTGEDKADSTNVYARLNEMMPYREQEYRWLEEHIKNDKDMETAPFRVIVMHQPDWGWLNGENQRWTDLANAGNTDLVIAGHLHRLIYIKLGARGNNFPILVVGQDQVARVDASAQQLKVTVTDRSGKVLESFSVPRREGKQ